MDIENRDVIIVEDIVDTGVTLEKLHLSLTKKEAKSICLIKMLIV